MQVFVSGATGRVGGTLARALMERGWKVRTLALPNDRQLEATRQAGIECVTGNLADLAAVREAMRDCDSVFHMAAVISFQPQARDLIWDANVMGTYNVLRVAAEISQSKPVRLVFASSDQVYPTRFARYRPTDELHPREPYTFYGLSKVIGEDMVKFYGRSEKNLSTSIAVFSHIEAAHELIDPNGEYSSAAFYVNGRVRSLKAASTHHAGATSQNELREILDILEPLTAEDEPLLLAYDQHGKPHTQELVDVRDIVDGLLLIHDKSEAIGETFNLAPATPVSLAEFIPYLAKATGRRYVEAKIPVELGRTHGSAAKARALLGYQPRYSLFDMVDEAVAAKHKEKAAA
ncbi:NAD(P)-dependent oxidoreductase [Variovorax sp. YR216]|uniref:NAD-dependent epimerase/dehydratase family protein n=1 Tax=Variovorax sp. YR216 TaxID=1882828 RepID=UPI00089C2723|nr:NAD(P)-dependent oxidoreductase [Variovorax sp. YR216]SEB25059.1 UDP-glucose 4-epimerase [Variovorax sp. YR216]